MMFTSKELSANLAAFHKQVLLPAIKILARKKRREWFVRDLNRIRAGETLHY